MAGTASFNMALQKPVGDVMDTLSTIYYTTFVCGSFLKINSAIPVSNTSAISVAPNCFFTCVSDEGQSGENAEQSSTSLKLADAEPVSPCLTLHWSDTICLPKQEDPRFPSKVQLTAVTAHLFIACTC